MQVLPLALAVRWAPFDPYRMLELLLLPDGPVPRDVGRELARVSIGVQKGPPIGVQKGPLWRRLVPVVHRRDPRAAECPTRRLTQRRVGGPCGPTGASGRGLRSEPVLEPPALVAGLDDIAVVGQAIEQRRGHLGVAEHAGPFAEGQVCGDDDRGPLVKPADEVEQKLAAGLSARWSSLVAD